MYNEVYSFKTEIPLDTTYDDLLEIIEKLIENVNAIYAYFVGRKNDNIVIRIHCSLTEEYNTFKKEEVIETITSAIVDYLLTLKNVKCICFGQPPLELLVKLYQPMLIKMAYKIHNQWQMFEIDDIVSMANLVVVKLYKQGYYIHKRLIWTALNNDVLVQCRKFKYQPLIIALEDTGEFYSKTDDEKLTYKDMLKDSSYEEQEEKEDEQQLEQYVFEEVKSIIIDKIGERQWDRLWRDYGKGHTTNSTQATMRRMKAYISELGLTRQDFINHYRR